MAGPMNSMQGGWQNFAPTPTPQYTVSALQNQMMQGQNGFGQNGGNFGPSQQIEAQFVGRFINQIDEVTPKEVPMDGRPAIFPTQSLDEIYLKAWDRYGTIKTFRYILDPNQNLNAPLPQQEPDMQSRILERLDELEQRLGEAQQSKTANRTNSKGGDK